MATETNYQEYFQPEIDALENQFNKNEKLYNEVHSCLEINIDKINSGKQMFGASTPHRDIADLGKVLNEIRSNQVATIKEKSNIKKTIKEFEFKRDNMKQGEKNNVDAQTLMKELVSSIQTKNMDILKPNPTNSMSGADKLKNLDPAQLGINENDFKMIDQFKKRNS
jgi:prolyl-tRNA synthetase